MIGSVRHAAMLMALAILFGCAAKASENPKTGYSGLPLEKALEDLKGRGLKLVYSSALVRPEMKVAAEPLGSGPREVLEKLLAPHGLAAKAGPDGTVLVVKGARGEAAVEPGIVSFVKVLSDKVPDISNLDAWKASYIKEGMTDEQKAMAVWKSVWTFQYQDSPPYDFIHPEGMIVDAMKTFNVYGYSMCGNATGHSETLARHIGLKARGFTINCHVVSELFYDEAWHLHDASLICYFPKADGKAASIEEIKSGILKWLEGQPGMKGDDAKLRAFHKADGWQGWKKGPEILNKCPTYSNSGWLPAGTHGWYSQMEEYDGSNNTPFMWEPGYSVGYQVNIQLRKGERLTRNWFHKGLHVNMPGEAPGCLEDKNGFLKKYDAPMGGSLAPGRVGNGTHEYNVPLAGGEFRGGAIVAESLATKAEAKGGAAVQVKDAAKDGVLELRMACSYVYLGGDIQLQAAVGKGGSIQIAFSDSNGVSWKDAGKIESSGEQKIPLKDLVFRRYDYRLRFTLKGEGTGLDALKIVNDIQHSQRPLPALGQGENAITYSAGPQEGTVTIEPTLCKGYKDKQAYVEDFKPEIHDAEITDGGIVLGKAGPKGDITFKVSAPGDITRLRFGSHFRCRDKNGDSLEYQVSFDGGKTFKTLEHLTGPCYGPAQKDVKYITYNEVPAGTREALVRFAGEHRTVVMLFNLRIDADYMEPAGGVAPVKVSYLWEENGQAKQDVRVVKQDKEAWTIKCEAKPLMKSIVLERE